MTARTDGTDRAATDATDAQDRAVDLAYETLDDGRAAMAYHIAHDMPQWRDTGREAMRDVWLELAIDDVRDGARQLALAAIVGESARDDDARDSLADWIAGEAPRIAADWIAERGIVDAEQARAREDGAT